MTLVSVARAIRHPRLRQSFSIERNAISYIEGRATLTPSVLARTGVLQPATKEEMLAFLPEGERTKAAVAIYCIEEVRMANGVDTESDVVTWLGTKYRVMFAKQWQQHGYWFAVGVAL